MPKLKMRQINEKVWVDYKVHAEKRGAGNGQNEIWSFSGMHSDADPYGHVSLCPGYF
jgi:hypothetical protein